MSGTRRELFTEFVDHNFVPVVHSSDGGAGGKGPLPSSDQVSAVLSGGDVRKMKSLLRTNSWPVDHNARKTLWSELCSKRHAVTGDVYDDMVRATQGTHGDLPPFVDQKYLLHYHLNSDGLTTARRILTALNHACPDVVYCPALYPTTCLLLHYMNERESFNCLYSMIRDSNKSGFFTQTKMAYRASGYVLKDLAKKYAKPTYSLVAKKYKKTENVFAGWIWWILNHVPFAYLVRIMDCYLVEGIKVFYRVALAMMILFSKLAVKSSPQKTIAEHIQEALNQFSEDMPVAVEKLLKTAFNIRGFQRKEITKLQVKNEMILQSLRHAADNGRTASSESLDKFVGEAGLAIELNLAGVGSSLIGSHEFQTIWQWLPIRMTCYTPVLLYTTDEHGTSLRTLYQRCEDREIPATILLVKTTQGDVFGAYCSADWIERKQHKRALAYFGTGESFVFTVKPHVRRYEWAGKGKTNSADVPADAHMFQAASDQQLTVGGGGGEAIRLDEELREGLTEHCSTFDNPPLAQDTHFTCTTLEVIGFT